ncbi:hypothetical protein GN244_ATG11486 [Phytophthora infestans]|uniref:Uncharacterized protein n=1 Tax=Phytophthora infestans TaxID=4787 RepID=A0A833SLG3_PHYIN|nr:hypothetical protein GN244_ATG11486 [Phytophthora infestans]KAF4146152.1 hypothetical protein GN958_ATG04627 [Phytophthora infestans]
MVVSKQFCVDIMDAERREWLGFQGGEAIAAAIANAARIRRNALQRDSRAQNREQVLRVLPAQVSDETIDDESVGTTEEPLNLEQQPPSDYSPRREEQQSQRRARHRTSARISEAC